MALPPVEPGAPDDGYDRQPETPARRPSRPTGHPRPAGTTYPSASHGQGKHHRPDPGPGYSDSPQPEVFGTVPAQNPNIRPDRYANDLLWIMYEDRTGRMFCERHVAGLGLAAAMLVELAVGGWVTAEKSILRTGKSWVPLRDVATHELLEQIASEPQALTVRQWLDFLSRDALERTFERLVRECALIREERQRRFRSPVVTYTAASSNDAAWPRARLATFVIQGQRLGPHDLVLTALCEATGLLHMVFESVPNSDRAAVLRHVDAYLTEKHLSAYTIIRDLEDAVTTKTAALA